MKKTAALFIAALLTCGRLIADDFYGVWFDKPVSEFVGGRWTTRDRIWERFPLAIGNGYMGAMVFGETDVEEIQFNEKSLWAGGPHTGVPAHADDGKTFHKVRKLFIERKIEEGSKLGSKLLADRSKFGKYQNMGSFFIKTGHKRADTKEYFRGLDLTKALSIVRYEHGGVKYERESFASYPARAMFSKWSASEKGKENIRIYPVMAHMAAARWEEDTLIVHGKLADNSLSFETRLKIDAPGGKVIPNMNPPTRKVTATAQSAEGEFTPAMASDSNNGTYWQTVRKNWKPLNGEPRTWLQLDYGKVMDIDGVLLNFQAVSEVKFKVDISEDGENWTTIVDKNPGEGKKGEGKGENYFKHQIKTRYVRMISYEWARYWGTPLRVTEFRAIARGEDPKALTGPYLEIKDADEVYFTQTCATGHKHEYPNYKGEAPAILCARIMNALKKADYVKEQARHAADYGKLYNRVKFVLPDAVGNSIPSNIRKQNFSKDHKDQAYIKLYFDACRYLLIASSRSGSLPANLQGVWCDSNFPAWNSDYHTNINLQMNYWAASPCGLEDCLESLFEYLDALVEPGSVTAKRIYGARGWVVNTGSNAWGFTAPHSLTFGWAPYGSSWVLQRMWEHYTFTADKTFLRARCYPHLKKIAFFWEDYLTEDTDGTLVSAPSYSPEHGPTTVGCAFDQVMAWNHLSNCIDASKDLDVDEDLRNEWIKMRDKLSPLKIGKWGQLQEWKEDIDDPEDRHRHINHMFSVFPGRQINAINTPNLAEAAKILMKGRGESGPGWSTAWKVGIQTRLLDSEGGYRKVHQLACGTYDNMFGAHRAGGPFQFDSNGGGSSAIPEMVLQSHVKADGVDAIGSEGYIIHLLPALPKQWPEGEFEGLRARGGYICDIFWKEGKLEKAIITSSVGGTAIIRYGDKNKQFKIKKGQSITLAAKDFSARGQDRP